MVSKAQKFRLGLFILISTFVLIAFLFSVIGKTLMEKKDNYTIHYKNVSINGLQVGGQVKYHGITIGRVEAITIDPNDIEVIIVEISLQAGTPIKKDVEATLVPIGITGLVLIELTGGSNQAELLKPNSIIKPGVSTFQNITGKAEVIAEKLEILLNNFTNLTSGENQEKIVNILHNVDSIITENKKSVNHIVTNLDSTTIYINSLAVTLHETIQKVNTVIDSKEFESIFANSEKFTSDLAEIDFSKLISDINSVVEQTNNTLSHIDGTFFRHKRRHFGYYRDYERNSGIFERFCTAS